MFEYQRCFKSAGLSCTYNLYMEYDAHLCNKVNTNDNFIFFTFRCYKLFKKIWKFEYRESSAFVSWPFSIVTLITLYTSALVTCALVIIPQA